MESSGVSLDSVSVDNHSDLSFEDVLLTTGPAIRRVWEYLTVKDVTLFSLTNRCLRVVVGDFVQKASGGSRTTHIAMGDEVVWQRRTPDGEVNFRSFVSPDVTGGFSLVGNPPVCEGPTGEMDSLDVSLEGQAVVLPQDVSLGMEWTICAWSIFRDGAPLRRGFVQPEGWLEGENALVSSVPNGDDGEDQHVFYSEARGNWLGCFREELVGEDREGVEYKEWLDVSGFFSSHYSFRYSNISDGWHHVAAVGSNWRLGMGDKVPAENGNGSIRYYVDGQLVGSVPYNLLAPVRIIGNVSEYGEYTQPWGVVSDFRMFRRALSPEHLRLIMVTPATTDEFKYG